MALFDRALISPEAAAAFPDGFVVRPLQRDDYGRGFFRCLADLTDVGDVSEERFQQLFDWMAEHGKGMHYFVVVEHAGEIVGTGTLVVERKFIRNLGMVGHVEEICIRHDFQAQGLGLRLLRALSSVAQSVGCFKSTLACSEKNAPFYVKCGYTMGGRCMSEEYRQ